jgi:hypothetical protein
MNRIALMMCALLFTACGGSRSGFYAPKGTVSGWTKDGGFVDVYAFKDALYDVAHAPVADDGSFQIAQLPAAPAEALVKHQLRWNLDDCSPKPTISPDSFQGTDIQFNVRDRAGYNASTRIDSKPLSLEVMYTDRDATIEGVAECPIRPGYPKVTVKFDVDLVAGYNATQFQNVDPQNVAITSAALPDPLVLVVTSVF